MENLFDAIGFDHMIEGEVFRVAWVDKTSFTVEEFEDEGFDVFTRDGRVMALRA